MSPILRSQANDASGVSSIEPIDDWIDDEGMLSNGNPSDLANLKFYEAPIGVGNRNTADIQPMPARQIEDGRLKEALDRLTLVQQVHQNAPTDGNTEQGLAEDTLARRRLLT